MSFPATSSSYRISSQIGFYSFYTFWHALQGHERRTPGKSDYRAGEDYPSSGVEKSDCGVEAKQLCHQKGLDVCPLCGFPRRGVCSGPTPDGCPIPDGYLEGRRSVAPHLEDHGVALAEPGTPSRGFES